MPGEAHGHRAIALERGSPDPGKDPLSLLRVEPVPLPLDLHPPGVVAPRPRLTSFDNLGTRSPSGRSCSCSEGTPAGRWPGRAWVRTSPRGRRQRRSGGRSCNRSSRACRSLGTRHEVALHVHPQDEQAADGPAAEDRPVCASSQTSTMSSGTRAATAMTRSTRRDSDAVEDKHQANVGSQRSP